MEFFNFYLYSIGDYWYEDDGMFNEKITWILNNTFKGLPSLITQVDQWRVIMNNYIGVLKNLLHFCNKTHPNYLKTYKDTSIYFDNCNKIQSHSFLETKNTSISSFPQHNFPKTSSKTFKNCYNLLSTVTCIDYPYLCR